MQAPESLGDQYQLGDFDCGDAPLNRWLTHRARQNEREGVSRTVVVCLEDSKVVIAYSCLSAGAILLSDVPNRLRRNMPNPLPVLVMGRLAVDQRYQGKGLGRALVADALSRSLKARQLIGAKALLVHALDDRAAGFYRSLGFRPSPIDVLTLMIQLDPV